MAIFIQKFGGSSVGDLERIDQVAKIIASTRDQGHDVVVVVSAMNGETDRLINYINAMNKRPDPREYDALVSTGEQISASLLSIALQNLGVAAKSLNAHQIPILTDGHHLKANIESIDSTYLVECINEGIVPVVTGFQGIDKKGHITTLGRGGSDMTAVALASALNADECQIFTDVDGVYTSDPRVVSQARLIPQITFDEMLELSSLGAKVLLIRAVEYANKNNVPLRVLSTFQSGAGTLVNFMLKDYDKTQVSGIAIDGNQAKLSVLGIPNETQSPGQILEALNQARIDVDMIVQNAPSTETHIDFSFTVALDDYVRAKDLMEMLVSELKAKDVFGDQQIAKLSVVGVGMRSHAGVAAKMLQTLDKEGIKIHLITSSEIKICVIIDKKHMARGAKALHLAFGLHNGHTTSIK